MSDHGELKARKNLPSPAARVYVLKTRAITGALVPFRGEHVEYDSLDRAVADAALLRDAGEDIHVIDFATDEEISL